MQCDAMMIILMEILNVVGLEAGFYQECNLTDQRNIQFSVFLQNIHLKCIQFEAYVHIYHECNLTGVHTPLCKDLYKVVLVHCERLGHYNITEIVSINAE